MLYYHTQYLESRMNLFHEAKKVLDKDGKVNPLGPYGKMKLTGQEVANYFRKNKVSDAKVKRAVEVALDMSGAMDIASKEIKKFFGDKILKSKEVQNALQYANESVVSEGMKMKDIMRKHKRELNKAYKSGDLSFMSSAGKKAEDDLMQWAMDNGEVKTDDPDDFFDWLSRDLEDIVKGKIKEDVKEGYFQIEMEDDDYYPNAEKMYVDIIKKAGGKNIKVYKPSRMDPQLGIDFKGGNISRMRKELDKKGDGTETIDENYRTLAKHGMGAETPKSIKVGTEVDYYQKDGAKYMGKITKMSRQSYTVRDDKTKKDHEFFYHDRIKAAKLLKQGDNIEEKVEYAEYKFRNKRDAQKALDYFKRQQLIKLDINDDGLSQYELAIDAGKKDMTKQHKEILKMLKPKVLTTEAVSPAQQAAIAIDRKEKRSKGAYKNVMDSYRQMWQDASIEEGKYLKYSNLLLKKAKEMEAIDKAQDKSKVKNPSLNALKAINKEIEAEMKKLGIKESINEEMITYRVKKMQKPEEQKFTRSAKMMGLKITMDKGKDDTVIVMSGTKKKLRDFDAIARGKSSFGDPSTISHFDEDKRDASISTILEKAYDENDVKKVQQLEKKLQGMLKEVDKTMKGSGLSAPAFNNVRSGIVKGLQSIQKFYKIAKK